MDWIIALAFIALFIIIGWAFYQNVKDDGKNPGL
jgi:predicted negative regulator of RcsB-dependent stress response